MTDTLVGKLVCPAPFRSPRVDCRPAPFGSAPSRSDSASAPRRGLVRAARAAGWSGWPRAAPAPGVVYWLAHRLEHQLKPARTGLLPVPSAIGANRTTRTSPGYTHTYGAIFRKARLSRVCRFPGAPTLAREHCNRAFAAFRAACTFCLVQLRPVLNCKEAQSSTISVFFRWASRVSRSKADAGVDSDD